MSDAVADLIAAEGLPADYAEVVERHWKPLADRIATRAAGHTPLIVGINGAQGSGKTTLCRFLELLLGRRGLRAVTLSIDDIYLTRTERMALARQVHPLFATRGVPGTHSPALGMEVIEAIRAGRAVTLPRFDKAMDDRAPESVPVPGPVDVLLFEGWCLGAIPQDEAALAEPVNALEAEEDVDGTWRDTVNRLLGEDYARLFAQVDLLLMLKVGSFAEVRRNRRLQEEKLRARNPGAPGPMSPAEVDRFLSHFERLTLHMLDAMPARADLVIPIGPDQRPL
ncbi:hypothetical protein [Aurantiacibacter luteus]|uniref:Uncharacterized protein n=1 Tax=Aurantiacibacter luteus TaxID=1581420 RepID=A0A0G9MWH6_9SPHN|nr:hypothetical protein [Aurantiacibacter luteus]KLE35091.1 hypothetical protein AAW00_00960 [Aurantiacibacter luteus]